MRNFFTVFILTLAISSPYAIHALDNNALYKWQTKDGTPTFSPDPPPPGVDYVVVDADLNPLPVQPPKPAATATGLPTTPVPAALPSPAANTIPKWKPIRYATDPAKKPLGTASATTTTPTPSSSGNPEPVTSFTASQVSQECLQLKRETQILESYFSEAATAAEMDQAILKLQQKTESYKKRCG